MLENAIRECRRRGELLGLARIKLLLEPMPRNTVDSASAIMTHVHLGEVLALDGTCGNARHQRRSCAVYKCIIRLCNVRTILRHACIGRERVHGLRLLLTQLILTSAEIHLQLQSVGFKLIVNVLGVAHAVPSHLIVPNLIILRAGSDGVFEAVLELLFVFLTFVADLGRVSRRLPRPLQRRISVQRAATADRSTIAQVQIG